MSSKTKLYELIIRDLLNDIESGRLQEGDKIPTDAELCVKYKVSRITVTRALKELEYRGLLIRIKKKGSFIKKPSNHSTEENEPGGIPAIAIVLPFGEDYGFDILQGAESVCARAGYYVTFHNSKYDGRREREILDRVFEDRLQGAIVYPCDGYRNIEIYSKLMIHKFPFAFIDRTVGGLDVPYVVSDNVRAGYDITAHLLELGHRKIAFVCTELNEAISVSERYKGYCSALISHGIAPKPEWLIEDHVSREQINHDDPEVRLAINQGRLARILSLDNQPTAIVAVNDETAIQLMKAAKLVGVEVPVKLSIAGFDNLQAGAVLDIPLTTMQQNFYEMGASAAQLVLSMISEKDNENVDVPKRVQDTKLIVRQSTSALQ